MKKISTIILPALVIGAAIPMAFSPGANAMRTDSDGSVWWSVSELLDYKKVVDQEINAQCGDDPGCRQELYFSKIEGEDQKFRALEMLTEQQFVLTGVNPSQDTFKVLFFDEDMMLGRMGIKEKLSLENLYIGLFDSQVERIYNHSSMAEPLANDEFPEVHKVYSWDSESSLPAEIIANQETELKNTSGLPLDSYDRFGYAIYAGQFNAQGQLLYGSCFKDPEYKEGEECHLMISPEKGTSFFVAQEKSSTTDRSQPSQEDLVTPSNQNEPEQTNPEPQNNQGALEQTNPEPQNDRETLAQNNSEPQSQDASTRANSEPQISQDELAQAASAAQPEASPGIKTPETGATHSGEENKASNVVQATPYFALEVVVILLFAIYLAKKSKKGVDNATGV